MGFPSGYTEEFLPKFLLNFLSLLGSIRAIVLTLLRLTGLPHFLEPDSYSSSIWPEPDPEFQSLSAALIRELLPVSKFRDCMEDKEHLPESCAVCLYDFEDHEEIRRLTNCSHIFHKGCVDRWMDHDQRTCPLCRAPFVPDHLVDAFNDKLWACPQEQVHQEFGVEFSPINTFL